VLDVARYVGRADRMLRGFVEALAAEDFQRPSAPSFGFRGLGAALNRAATTLGSARVERHRRIEYLSALLDEASAALFVMEERGAVEPVNRAAGKLGIEAMGTESAAQLRAIAPGERLVIRLTNGQRVLASAARFVSGGSSRRLVSLQNIESELDAAELQAWRDLVRILAHEMMNSLTPVVSLAQSVQPLLREMDAPPDVANAVDTIARRSAGLMSFVERYRKVTDLPRPVPREIALAEVVGRIEQLMAPTFVQKGIAYSVRVEPAELALRADPELLEQALINLVHNAVDAVADVEAPRIDIECSVRGECVAVAVSDNGCGLDAATREQIFVPFFSTKPGGSGIGLALARQIARAHHGQVEVVPHAGGGTVFSLVVPARDE
jgi:two-component system, NtrC family, nitrogen regulation sensor histidine kinase NtrY